MPYDDRERCNRQYVVVEVGASGPLPETAWLMTVPTGTAMDGATVDAWCEPVAEARGQGAAVAGGSAASRVPA